MPTTCSQVLVERYIIRADTRAGIEVGDLVFLVIRGVSQVFAADAIYSDIGAWGMDGVIPVLVGVHISRRTATQPHKDSQGAIKDVLCTVEFRSDLYCVDCIRTVRGWRRACDDRVSRITLVRIDSSRARAPRVWLVPRGGAWADNAAAQLCHSLPAPSCWPVVYHLMSSRLPSRSVPAMYCSQ